MKNFTRNVKNLFFAKVGLALLVSFISVLAVVSCKPNVDTPPPAPPSIPIETVIFSVEGGNGTIKAEVDGTAINTGAKIEQGKTIKFTATANEHYEVDKWTIVGGVVTSDGTEGSKTAEVVKGDTAVTVKVSFILKSVCVFEVNGKNGTLEAKVDGTAINTGAKIEQGKTIKFIATANEHYEVDKWTIVGGEFTSGGTEGSKTAEVVKGEHAVKVYVSFRSKYTVRFNVKNGNGTLEATVSGNGVNTGDRVEYGKTVTFTAKPDAGYKVKEWTIVEGEFVEEPQYSTEAKVQITGNYTITVEFTEAHLKRLQLPGTLKEKGNSWIPEYTYKYGEKVSIKIIKKTNDVELNKLHISVKGADNKEYGIIGTKENEDTNTITVEYTYPSKSDVLNLEDLKFIAEYEDEVLEENFLPAFIKGTELKGWKKDSAVTKAKLPAYITMIGYMSFSGCTGLTSIAFPESIILIRGSAFSGCTGLTSINLSCCTGLREISFSAFSRCTGLTSVTLPERHTEIKGEAFSKCTSLTSIVLPKSLTKIEERTFSGCTSLTNIALPKGLTKIEERSFFGCTSLTSIDFSKCTKLTSIGEKAFSGCKSATVKLPDSVITFEEYVFGDGNDKHPYCKAVSLKTGGTNTSTLKQRIIEEAKYPEDRIIEYE